MHVDVYGAELDLSCFNSAAVGYAGVRVGTSDTSLSVISVYVWPNSSFHPYDISKFRAFCGGRILIFGDFNAHLTIWGENHNSARRSALMDALVVQDPAVLNDASNNITCPR